MTQLDSAPDYTTAQGFASSWNTVGDGSVYTRAQFLEWFSPLDPAEFAGRDVLELGYGNGSLLAHMGMVQPRRLAGVELGDTLEATRKNLSHLPPGMLELHRADLTKVDLGGFDLVYCIGVLHHLSNPEDGFLSVLRHTRPGGHFHCWVYAREGNAVIRSTVEPLRRVASRLPWWLTKYALATPLVLPYYGYAKLVRGVHERFGRNPLAPVLPLYDYSLWIGQERFKFFQHVAFDQLVAASTQYLPRATVEEWLSHPDVDPAQRYISFRNGNSWKFGGRKRPPRG